MGNKTVARRPKGSAAQYQKMAQHVVKQVLKQLAPQVHTGLKVAKAGYDMYQSRKRAAPQAGATKKKVVEKQLETQIAGGHGVTFCKKVVGKRLTKLPPSVRMQKEAIRNAREIYDQGVASSAVNQQAFVSVSQTLDLNDFTGIMGTNAPNVSKKLFIEACVTTLEFANVCNAPVELTLFQHIPTDSQSLYPVDRFKQGLDRKFGDSANVELKMFHGPHESGTLLKFYRCTYAKKVVLSPGENAVFKIYNNINKTIKNDAFMNAANDGSNWTFSEHLSQVHTVLLRGFTIFEEVSGEGGRGVYSPTKVAFTSHKRIIYRTWDSGVPAQSTYSTNDLAPVTGAIKEVLQETASNVTFGNL